LSDVYYSQSVEKLFFLLTLQHNSEAIVDRIRLQDRVEVFCEMGTRWVAATPLYEQAGFPFKSTFTKNGGKLKKAQEKTYMRDLIPISNRIIICWKQNQMEAKMLAL
jgi:hypothetical protein